VLQRLAKIGQKLTLVNQLGISSISRFIWYKLQLNVGYFKWRLAARKLARIEINPPILEEGIDPEALLHQCISRLLDGKLDYFFNHSCQVNSPPDWFYDPFQSKKIFLPNNLAHWTQINFFNLGCDVKIIWEPSRFYWFPRLVQGVMLSDTYKSCLETLNIWLNDWIEKNPVNLGPNWLCAQETSIRLMNFLLGLHLLKTQQFDDAIYEFINAHCQRILPSMSYAVSQNNNHATSEAAGLFLAGVWLSCFARNHGDRKQAEKYIRIGQKRLEGRVKTLILEDGTFAQYSVTYHRLILDTLSLAVYWQRAYKAKHFSKSFFQQFEKAFHWLYQLVDPISFDAPNLGANDGALLFKLDCCDYRDFRPSLQLAAYVLFNQRLFAPGSHDSLLRWLDVKVQALPVMSLNFQSQDFSAGGFLKVVMNQETWFLLRYPRFKFRPVQSDALHLDLWHKGENILSDSGSYSYNCETLLYECFSGTQGHNTVQIDSRNQMPRLGRFLFSDWLKASVRQEESSKGLSWIFEYTDYQKAMHQRTIQINKEACCLTIIDKVSHHQQQATLYWHFAESQKGLRLTAYEVDGKNFKMKLSASQTEGTPQLMQAPQSCYYLSKKSTPLIEFCTSYTGQAVVFKTVIQFDL
jgi:hypothetical protein